MEDFSNYKLPSMFIIFPMCDWKCDRECEKRVCQNGSLAKAPIKDVEKGMYGSDVIRNLVSAYKARDVEIAETAKESSRGENDGGEKEVKITSRQTSLI